MGIRCETRSYTFAEERTMRVRVAFGALLALLATSPGRAGQSAVEMVKDSGIRGGGGVHVGCGDGKLTASLRVDDSLVVQGLDRDPANAERARQHFHSLGLGGHLTASIFDGRRLPYADTLVNLLFVSDPSAISREEVLRVLCPGGAVYVESKAGEDWKTTVKPWPQEMDQWTHFLYGPRSSHGRGGQDARRCRRIHPGSPSSLLSQQGDRAVHHHGTDGNRVRQSRRRPQADGKVFVADVERHTLYALDLATGEEVWSHVDTLS